jgi:hypothetical protein
MPKLEIHYDPDREWAALYVDGQLDGVGDAYVREERAFELCGVQQVKDNAFLRGQDRRDGVAKTLAEVAEYRRARDDRAAARKREEAARLLAEADEIERAERAT